tara:strand:- start:16 stop:411 length:396 start_codon:yes stop_codon:yes gene_type:complete
MAFTYCPSCGYKNLHGVHAPKFCGGCGATLDGPMATKAVAKTKRIPTRQSVEDDEDGTDVYQVPEIGKLKYTVSDGGLGANKASLKDVAGEITEEQLEEVQREERGAVKKKRGRPKGSKNSTHGKKRTKRK